MIAGVVLTILLVVGVTLLVSYGITRTYVDKRETSAFVSLICTLGIAITLLCVLLIPVDIYVVSSSLNADGSQSDPGLTSRTADAIQSLYYAMYVLLVVWAFFLLPFCYFFFEEESEDGRLGPRIWTALKYSIGFILFFFVLLTLGLVLKKGKQDDSTDWKHRLANDFTGAEAILSFCIGCLACIGLIAYSVYAAYGLARMPLKLMSKARVRPPSLASLDGIDVRTAEDVDLSLRRNQENMSYLESQYSMSGRAWSKEDQEQMKELKREHRRLQSLKTARARRSGHGGGSSVSRLGAGGVSDGQELSWSDKCWNFLVPIRMAIGILFIGLSLLIITSLSITVVDKFLHSDCGASCGYTLSKSTILNPIDEALKKLAQAFPMDCLAFGGLTLYIFLACVSGVVGLGVRFFIFHLYTVHKGRTMPNAFLMATWLFQMMTVTLNMEVLTLSPTYATFGNQFWLNATSTEPDKHLPCDIHNIQVYENTCVQTQIGRFINTMSVESPFFNVILFYGNLAFLGFYVLFLAHGAFCADNGAKDELDEFRRLDEDSD